MKKLILVALAAVMMAGCLEIKSKQNNKIEALEIYGSTYYTPNGCEYYIYGNHHGGFPIHKEDCKKCQERREKEIERIVELLKENSYDND